MRKKFKILINYFKIWHSKEYEEKWKWNTLLEKTFKMHFNFINQLLILTKIIIIILNFLLFFRFILCSTSFFHGNICVWLWFQSNIYFNSWPLSTWEKSHISASQPSKIYGMDEKKRMCILSGLFPLKRRMRGRGWAVYPQPFLDLSIRLGLYQLSIAV